MSYSTPIFLQSFKFKIILFSVVLGLSIFMFGSNLGSLFSIIDDHNIVKWFGNDENFSTKDFIIFLQKSQDFQIGEHGRFRPAQEISKAIEMFLFNNNVFLYQLSRFIVFVLIIQIFSMFIIQKIGILYGPIVSLILISEPAWTDIFIRIITSEIFTFYGLVVFLPISFSILYSIKNNINYKSNIKKIFMMIFYLLSGLISIGCKENFVFLILIPITILIFNWKLRKSGYFHKFINYISVALIGYGLFIISIIIIYFWTTSDDISGYGIASMYVTSLKVIKSFFEIFFINWMGIFLIIPVILLIILKNNKDYCILKKWSLQFYSYILLLSFLLLFQVIYYTGGLPAGNRYDFPNIFFYSLYLVLIIIYVKKITQIFVNNKIYLKAIILVPLIIILIIKNPLNGIIKANEASYAHKERTKEFQSVIDTIVHKVDSSSETFIIVHSYNVWDYELITSFYKYMRHRGITNNIYLQIHYKTSNYSSSVEKMFVKRLYDVSKGNGLKNKLNWTLSDNMDWGFSSFEEIKNNQAKCLNVKIINNIDIKVAKINTNKCAFTVYFKYKGP